MLENSFFLNQFYALATEITLLEKLYITNNTFRLWSTKEIHFATIKPPLHCPLNFFYLNANK